MTIFKRLARPATVIGLLTLGMLAGQLAGCAPTVKASSSADGKTTYYEGPVKPRYSTASNRR